MGNFVDNAVDKSKLRSGAVRLLYGEMKLRIMHIMLTPLDKRAGICYGGVNSTRRGAPPYFGFRAIRHTDV